MEQKTGHALFVKSPAETGVSAHPRTFATTRWSLILLAADSNTDETKAREALAELCRIYWRPIFLFISRRGYSLEEAQDLTQDFFVMILESNWLEHADEHRGRFRSFLLGSLQNFLGHANEKKRALKRGGSVKLVSWDELAAETASLAKETPDSMPPERMFDMRWAATVVEQALQRLREECESHGRLRLFEALRGHLASERSELSYANLAMTLGVAETVVKKQLHNLRQRYRWLLRDEVANTVENPGDVDDEIRHLCAVLATQVA